MYLCIIVCYFILLGLKFWKQPRRKIYAVTRVDFRGKNKKRAQSVIYSSSEEESTSKKFCYDKKNFTDLTFSIDEVVAVLSC